MAYDTQNDNINKPTLDGMGESLLFPPTAHFSQQVYNMTRILSLEKSDKMK